MIKEEEDGRTISIFIYLVSFLDFTIERKYTISFEIEENLPEEKKKHK